MAKIRVKIELSFFVTSRRPTLLKKVLAGGTILKIYYKNEKKYLK